MDIEQEYAHQQLAIEASTELQERTGRNSVFNNQYSEKKWKECIFPSQLRLTTLKLDLSRQQWAQGEFTIFCGGLASMNNLTSIDLDLSHNFIEDAGSVLLSNSLSKLSKLTNISLDLQRNYLQRNAFSVLLTLNSLQKLSEISLDLRGNTLDLEAELPSLLPQFHNQNVFEKVTSFNLSIDDVKVVPEIKPSPSQAHLEESIRNLQAQLQQLISASRQFSQFPSHLAQLEQQAQQINLQIANAKNQLQHELKSNKKSGACRLFEIMLKFTSNLQIFGFSYPGQLIGSREWEFLGGLLRNKSQSLKSLKLEGLNVNFQCPEMGYALYQIGKLSNLTSLSLSLHNLTANSELSLNRFLKNLSKLNSLTLDFSSMDALTPQAEITKDIAYFVASQANLQHLSLSVAHSSINDEISTYLFRAISSLSSLSSIQLSFKECKSITNTTLISICESLISCKLLRAISIDLSGANLQPTQIVSFLASLATSKAQNLVSFVFNYLSSNSRRQPFSQEESQQINTTLSSFKNLRKCIVTLPNNPLLTIFKEKAAQKNLLINSCLLAKHSKTFQVIRKDFAFQVLDFLI